MLSVEPIQSSGQPSWRPRLKMKVKRQSKSLEDPYYPRPLTATLERPLILDVALLKKLDMSTITKKGLVNLSNIYGMSVVKRSESKKNLSKNKKKLRKQVSEEVRVNRKTKKPVEKGDSSWEEENSSSEVKKFKRLPKTKLKVVNMSKYLKPKCQDEECSWEDDDSSASDVKNKKIKQKTKNQYLTNKTTTLGSLRKNLAKNNTKSFYNIDEVFGGPTDNIPEPCRTCGRPEQPERFHSHPKQTNKMADNRKGKNIITKPIPAKFKSAERKKTVEQVPAVQAVVKSLKENLTVTDARPKSGKPKTLTCYICSREFGTASLPLHEPKCMQKWTRENNSLPPELRRKLPEKPKQDMSAEEWNNFAWESSQAVLVPCGNCGRTFNPDRIEVHLRICKGEAKKSPEPAFRIAEETDSRKSSAIGARPKTVMCYICGREFGSKSISIHEPQCLKKWNVANDKLALEKRRSEPVRPATGEVDMMATYNSIWANHVDSLIPCGKCGRKFFPDRIETHESCCNNVPIIAKKKSPRN